MVVLREFLYRNDNLVAQFLEQLEGGEYEEEAIVERTQSTKGLGGSLGPTAANVSGERKKHGEREAALTLKQTGPSRFNRLHNLLDQEGGLQPLTAFDDAIWDQLRRHEMVEVDGVLQLAPGVSKMADAEALSAMAPLVEMMGSLPDEMLPEDFNRAEATKMGEQVPLVGQFAEHFANSPIPCTFSPVGSDRHKFFSELARDHMLSEVRKLEGEVTVLAKIQRHIVKGQPETVGGAGLPVATNREQRRKQKGEVPFTVRLSYPAAIVTVIAIYR